MKKTGLERDEEGKDARRGEKTPPRPMPHQGNRRIIKLVALLSRRYLLKVAALQSISTTSPSLGQQLKHKLALDPNLLLILKLEKGNLWKQWERKNSSSMALDSPTFHAILYVKISLAS